MQVELVKGAKGQSDTLIIKLPVNAKPVSSASGKTLVVASTHGNQVSPVQIDGQNVVVGVNAYIHKTA